MRLALLAAVGGLLLAGPSGQADPVARDGFDSAPVSLIGRLPRTDASLRVMSYNVKGMPWPITADRSADLAAIGDRLKRMRLAGTAPDVVVLQEAFTDDARAIAARAGYAHVAFGPSRLEVVRGDPASPMREQYRWRGEGLDPITSSGLVLMSDYPIVATRRIAFPRNACAGYDCLANKGVLLARIKVPGLALPIEILTTHMNSLRPTRTPIPHANEAFTRQMAVLDTFIAANADASLPMIFAGDMNLDSDPRRIAVLKASNGRWRKMGSGPSAAPVFAICGRPWLPCHPGVGFEEIAEGKRNNDWQMSFPSSKVAVEPVAASIRFMPDPAARVLSDHQAVMVAYRLSATSGRPTDS